MSSHKTTFFYGLILAVAGLSVGLVISSRLESASTSTAQTLTAPPPMNSAPLGGPVDAGTFRNIAKTVSPSVVNIRSTSTRRTQQLTEFFGGDDLLERFFGRPGGGDPGQRRQPREQETQSAGTGFVISKDGLILTNNHVVEGASKIEVGFFEEEVDIYHEAKVIGRDPLTDSALIQLVDKPKQELQEVKFGDSSQMQPGDWVMAIGNPFALGHTVSVGVISASGRPFPVALQRSEEVLQTDAAINPGNSGGPLLNVRGEVIGINTAIYTDARQQANIGIGFAMPINLIRELLPQLRTGKVTRGVIGVEVQVIDPATLADFGLKERRGALVATVHRGRPAAKAGMQPGDIILEFNGRAVKNRDELVRTVVATRPGTTVPVKVLRDRKELTLNVTVEELNLEDETGRQAAREPDANAQEDAGFGLTLGLLTPEVVRGLRLPQDTEGVVVTDVEPGSPADRARVAPRDIILQVNRRPVRTPQEASRALAQVPSGGTAFLLVLRDRQETFVTMRKE